jgi:hypothetical protein
MFTDGVGVSKDSHAPGEFHSDAGLLVRWIVVDSSMVEECANGGISRSDRAGRLTASGRQRPDESSRPGEQVL